MTLARTFNPWKRVTSDPDIALLKAARQGSRRAFDDLRRAHAGIPEDAWTDDPHGDPDWRRAMTLLLAEQICAELL